MSSFETARIVLAVLRRVSAQMDYKARNLEEDTLHGRALVLNDVRSCIDQVIAETEHLMANTPDGGR